MNDDKISQLYKKHNYKNKNLEYIKNCFIEEYDIKRAGLNILRNTNTITEEKYQEFLKMDKREADIIIGKWLRKHPEVSELMMNTYIEIRKRFFELNNITDDDDILSIKKDAIFVINHKCFHLEIDGYEFVLKNKFNSYAYINNYEFYYGKNKDNIVVKGMNHESVIDQKLYFIKLIKDLMRLDSIGKYDEMFELLVDFKDDFIMNKLELPYYKDIITNQYQFNMGGVLVGRDTIDEKIICNIFKNGNLNFLNNIIKTFL